MNSVDIYQLTRVSDINDFSAYESHLSSREDMLAIKPHEKDSLSTLVQVLLDNKIDSEGVSGFYFSYEIPQIGKEFDLLRINADKIINIELKSRDVDIGKVEKQLTQNRQYLSHLSRYVLLFTFVSSSKKVYYLDKDDHAIECEIDILTKEISGQTDCFTGDINSLFRVSDFLVSPLNTPEKFLKKEYFLTQQQQGNKDVIMQSIHAPRLNPKLFGITGGPGTGKTLALYDVAHDCSQRGRVCIIHCGILSDGHTYLNDRIDNMDIFPAKSFMTIDFRCYDYVFIDESHRIYSNQFDALVEAIIANRLACVFSYDHRQVLSSKERARDIAGRIRLLPGVTELKLSNKIRTNKEMASFIRRLLDLNSTDIQPNYPSVSIVYANTEPEIEYFIRRNRDQGFVFINYTQSQYYKGSFDQYSSDTDTHHVIGQEFDNVLMVIDDTFRYDVKRKLVAKVHPNPDYLYRQLLFQGLTRVREKLLIIVYNNPAVFKELLCILK